MKKIVFWLLTLLGICAFTLESCGPIVFTTRLGAPPPWFYPNRIETVRYVYFPDYTIYYDFTLRKYIYLDNNIWITASILPAKFNHINLRRVKHKRINNYYGDDIKKYHKESDQKRGYSNSSRRSTSRRN